MRMLKRDGHNPIRPVAARVLSLQALQRSKAARRELLLVVPLLVGALVVWTHRRDWFPADYRMAVKIGTALILGLLGWRIARNVVRGLMPWLARRIAPATAGTVGFLIRLIIMVVTVLAVLRVLGIKPQALALGGAVFAVVFGLGAQQTLGNVISGLVLIAEQPFRVGARVRLQAGVVAGQLEGDV